MEIEDTILRGIAHHTFSFTGKKSLLKGWDALLIWQYLRFNTEYQNSYNDLCARLRNADDPTVETETEIFCHRWCMSSPEDYKEPDLPKSFYFERRAIKSFKNLNVLNQWTKWNSEYLKNCLTISIDRNADKSIVLKEIERLLEQSDKANLLDKFRIKGSSKDHLADNFVCYYLRVVAGLKPKDVKLKYQEIYPSIFPLQNQQISKKVAAFKKVSAMSPWCFFVAPR